MVRVLATETFRFCFPQLNCKLSPDVATLSRAADLVLVALALLSGSSGSAEALLRCRYLGMSQCTLSKRYRTRKRPMFARDNSSLS
jgi:hypothetical protein